MIARQMRAGDVRTVWHPSPGCELLVTDNGNVRVVVGEQRAQVSDASFVEL